jgi:hypothetical protein
LRVRCHYAYWGNKSVAAPGDVSYVQVLRPILRQNVAQRVDVEAQASGSDNDLTPYSGHQLPIGHDLSGVLDQDTQNVEGAITQLDGDAISFQATHA